MEISLTTPALFFPAISLLLLAYTNRFLSLASLIRQLTYGYTENPDRVKLEQIKNLRTRIRFVRSMQLAGVMSLLINVLTMMLLFLNFELVARILFGFSMLLLVLSLAISFAEIRISTAALDIDLARLEKLLDEVK